MNHFVWDVRCSVAQLCPTLCDPMNCSPPGSSVHGISQARGLEWVAISFSRGSSQPRDGTCVSCIGQVGSLPLSHLGSPSTLRGSQMQVSVAHSVSSTLQFIGHSIFLQREQTTHEQALSTTSSFIFHLRNTLNSATSCPSLVTESPVHST